MAESFKGFIRASELPSTSQTDQDDDSTPTRGKRRRLHLDASKCHELTQSTSGSKVLSNPFEANAAVAARKHIGLAPVPRRRRSKESPSAAAVVPVDEPPQRQTAFSKLQFDDGHGFTAASSMLRLSAKPPARSRVRASTKFGKTDDKSQGSMLNFIQKVPREKLDSSSQAGNEEKTFASQASCSSQGTGSLEPISSPQKERIESKSLSQQMAKKGKSRSKTRTIPWKPTGNQVKVVKNIIEISSDEEFESNDAFQVYETNKINKTFGLVDVPSEEENVNYFERIPTEVQELIFCQLPVLDLFLNCNRVCKDWNKLVSSPKFIPWKKLHFRLMRDVPNALSEVDAHVGEDLMNMFLNPHKCLLAIIKRLKTLKSVTAGTEHMLQCLARHPKFHWATALMQERCPDCIVNDHPNPWSVVAALCLLADQVSDITRILELLTGTHSHCTSIEVVECLYAVAVLLLRLKCRLLLAPWSMMHYRLYYALYLFENASITTRGMLQEAMEGFSGQQAITQYGYSNVNVRLTHEQLRIVKHHLSPGEVIKIVAFAGTGKTTTLVQYTQYRPNLKFLLVVYNKSVQVHAVKQFPKNVTCRTGHSLAFARVGQMYREKLGNLKVYSISQCLQPRKGENLFVRAKFVLDTLTNFIASSDHHITTMHVPTHRLDEDGTMKEIPHDSRMLYSTDAEYLWGRMVDRQDKAVPMTHDGYLKLFQLRAPMLTGYDVILIDEAQDLTPAVIDILLQQKQPKILVGDPHQQIYGFRGAVNAMDMVTASHIFYLTQSFRFGPEIAGVAASCLQVLKGVKDKTIVGHGKPGKVTGEQVGQLCIISRCNYTLFNEAVKKCCYSADDVKVGFVGGTDGFGFPMLMDMYALTMSPSERERERIVIRDRLVKCFHSIVDLEKYAKQTSDVELLGKLRILHTHSANLPTLIRKIESKCVHDLSMAEIIFSTAHKAKGLEFSTVRVTDDFCQTGLYVLNVSAIPPDEKNLLYVAVTRAKNALQITGTILQILGRSGEELTRLVYSEDVKKSEEFKGPNGLPVCLHTGEEFTPKALTLRQLQVQFSNGERRSGGLFSPVMLGESYSPYAQLCGEEPVLALPNDVS